VEDEEDQARAEHAALRARWGITYPLHSVDMRSAAREFRWLRREAPQYQPFMEDLTWKSLKVKEVRVRQGASEHAHDQPKRVADRRNQGLGLLAI